MMSTADITGLITAIGAVATAITALVGVIKGLKQSKQNGAGITENGDGIAQVHDLVNARSDRQDQRIDQLTGTLTEADVAVPARPGEQ
jgi:hypothetical protein